LNQGRWLAAQERSFRIAHISDPHLSRQFYREHIKSFKLLLRSVLEMQYDHLIITGDIVSTADPDDYYLARELLSSMGFLKSNRITVIPGNHDIFGGPHRAIDVLSFPQHIRSVNYRQNLDLFREAFHEAFAGAKFADNNETYPFVKHIGPFVLIGLNSIPPWSMWKNPLGTNGMLSERQLKALDTLAHNERFRGKIPIVLLHHHLNDLGDGTAENGFWMRLESNTMRMKGRRKLLKVLQQLNVRFILHGHIHRNEIYERAGIHIANGAGAICDDPIHFLKINELIAEDGVVRLRIQQLPIPYQVSTSARSFHKFRSLIPIAEPATR